MGVETEYQPSSPAMPGTANRARASFENIHNFRES